MNKLGMAAILYVLVCNVPLASELVQFRSIEGSGINLAAPLSIEGTGVDSAAPQSIEGSGINLVSPQSIEGTGINLTIPQAIEGSGTHDIAQPQSIEGTGLQSIAPSLASQNGITSYSSLSIESSGIKSRYSSIQSIDGSGLNTFNRSIEGSGKPRALQSGAVSKLLASTKLRGSPAGANNKAAPLVSHSATSFAQTSPAIPPRLDSVTPQSPLRLDINEFPGIERLPSRQSQRATFR